MRGRLAAMGVLTLMLTGCLPWQSYTSTEGAFRVEMPGKPHRQSHTLKKKFDNRTFKTYTLNTAVVQLPHGAFLAAWADLPPGIQLDLPTQAQEIAAQYQGTLGHQGPAPQLAGVPGLDFQFTTKRPPGEGAARLWQFHNRLYLLLVLGPHVDPRADEVERFFGSMQLINPLFE
jgi:hypothetical protein